MTGKARTSEICAYLCREKTESNAMMEELQRWLRGKASLVLNVERLRSFSASRWPVELGTTHGVEHWDRVARFGTMLYREGADMNVILAFAYLHDTERTSNGRDLEHGKRASAFIDTIRGTMLQELSDEQIAKLKRACELHTIEHRTDDMTIDICFDADRMDLLRVNIVPLPARMATEQGAALVADPGYSDWYHTNFGKR